MDATLELGNDLLRAAARLTRWASRNASLGVPYAQARLLALIDELGPARISSLASADHSSQPALTLAVRRLEHSGWVERVRDPEDARASLVSLSPEGRAALEGVREARAEVLRPVLEHLQGREADAARRVRDAVAVLTDLLEAATPTPGRRSSHERKR